MTWVTCISPSDGSYTEARGGNSLSFKDRAQNRRLRVSAMSKRRKIPAYYVQKMMDHTYISLILPTAVYTAHITYQWQRCNGLQKSNGNLTLIILHVWFTFESLYDCIRWLFFFKEKGGKKQGQNTFQLNLKVVPSPSQSCTSIYCLIIQSENENWSLKHLYLNKEREADYECSKCNFYYTSIILLLITDSFSLCSSSKTCSYSIHVHRGGKKKLARLFEMFNLLRIQPTAEKRN